MEWNRGFWYEKSIKLGHTGTITLKRMGSVWKINVYSSGNSINQILFY